MTKIDQEDMKMNMNRVALNTLEQEQVNGGSIWNNESSIKEAGIELWKVYNQIPGDFGFFSNTGDYYFNGQRVDQSQINALEYYRKNKKVVAPSIEEAVAFYKNKKKHKFLH